MSIFTPAAFAIGRIASAFTKGNYSAVPIWVGIEMGPSAGNYKASHSSSAMLSPSAPSEIKDGLGLLSMSSIAMAEATLDCLAEARSDVAWAVAKAVFELVAI